MSDAELIDAIAKEWLRLGGDADGFFWAMGDVAKRIRELQEPPKGEP